jgi:CSLREA domain-containing protein
VKRGGPVIAGVAVAGLMLAANASAKTFDVTSTADTAPDGCNQGGCTLREAVIAANNREGEDTVVLRSGKLYRIEIPGIGEDAAATGDFDLAGPTIVRTSGRKRAQVHADGADRQFEAFARAELRNLTLTDGLAPSGSTVASHGGGLTLARTTVTGSGGAASAIFDDGPGRVALSRSRISGGGGRAVQDDGGGGVRVSGSDFSANNGYAVLVDGGGGIVFEDSEASDSPFAALYDSGPGGIRVVNGTFRNLGGEATLDFDSGGITIARSTIEDIASDAINDYDGGSITVKRSSVANAGEEAIYEAGPGNAIASRVRVREVGQEAINEYDAGLVRATRMRIDTTGNEALLEFGEGALIASRVDIEDVGADAVNEYDAGALKAMRVRIDTAVNEGLIEFGEGALTAVRSRISGAGDVGVEEYDTGNLSLRSSRVVGSAARGVSEHDEGGLRMASSLLQGNDGGLVTGSPGASRITGSTIAGNETAFQGGGIYAQDTLTLVNSTVANNDSGSYGAGIFAADGSDVTLNAVTVARNHAGNDGGGLYLAGATSAMAVDNSLIALNTVPGGGFVGADCFNEQQDFDSGGHNLLSTDDNCGGFDAAGDLVRAKPKLGQLKRNGGPTETIALKKGSPAIGHAGNDAPSRDQRGRKRDAHPDTGAFER